MEERGKNLNDNTRRQILEFLARNTRGATISEISNELSISRQTASKYLEILKAEKKIELREVGRAKLHYLKQENLENFTGAET